MARVFATNLVVAVVLSLLVVATNMTLLPAVAKRLSGHDVAVQTLPDVASAAADEATEAPEGGGDQGGGYRVEGVTKSKGRSPLGRKLGGDEGGTQGIGDGQNDSNGGYNAGSNNSGYDHGNSAGNQNDSNGGNIGN
ncbi:unnamed protein product [Linum trigynum]|uniref:Glycine-rich protein n=1 Tax=Linum trigynum TaxID=586398 RepID=A0AAV2EFZ6_9ROSI